MATMELSGVYDASRAAALSGVPKTTIYYWANNGILLPSISSEQTRLWSFQDLLAIRLIQWFRKEKATPDGVIPATQMITIRRALRRLKEVGRDVFDSHTR